MTNYDDEMIEAEIRGDDPVEAVTGVPADELRDGRCRVCDWLGCCRHSHSRQYCEC